MSLGSCMKPVNYCQKPDKEHLYNPRKFLFPLSCPLLPLSEAITFQFNHILVLPFLGIHVNGNTLWLYTFFFCIQTVLYKMFLKFIMLLSSVICSCLLLTSIPYELYVLGWIFVVCFAVFSLFLCLSRILSIPLPCPSLQRVARDS